ncbi:MAG: hypothetical protein J7604_24595 [Sporocytophaga sp.]|uniref:hypothetical protein n=1 Tax=Sporocytophaga sp. TaxID=2231183 RepID=UPI001B27D9C8|nr:hypothetical protein [Sporocytophaga sp.]MBO9703411.1 hypothetical protein [Sporocytophaga sp.]
MSNDNSHSEKLPVEDLFRDVFSDHKETVNEKDVEQFLGQLEDTGFFDKNKRRPLFIFFLTSVIVGGTIFYFTLQFQKGNQKATNNRSAKISDIPASGATENCDEEDVTENGEESNREHNIIQKKVSQPISDVSNNSQNVHHKETAVDNQVHIAEPEIQAKDTIITDVIPVLPVSKRQKDSIRIKYIIQVDTIKTIDSLNIRKRKWEKMKGKNK